MTGAHDVAFWNPGDRDIRPDHVYVADAIEALLTGKVADFIGRHRAPRKGLDVPPRGPVAVVHAGEMGDQKDALKLLEQRGFGVTTGDPQRHPHGAKEVLIWNPALVVPAGVHRVHRLAPGIPDGRRSGRRGKVPMPPKYLHLRDFRNVATGVVVTHGVLHYPPSVNLNAEWVRKIVRAHAAYLGALDDPAVVGGDWNMTADHRLATPLHLDGWANSQDTFGEVATFRHKGGKHTAIDWCLWREDPAYRPVGQLVVDMPGSERDGAEHYALVVEADVTTP